MLKRNLSINLCYIMNFFVKCSIIFVIFSKILVNGNLIEEFIEDQSRQNVFEQSIQPVPKIITLLGSTARIPCLSSSDTAYSGTHFNITWVTPNDLWLNSSSSFTRRMDTNGDLTISKVTEADGGTYHCIVQAIDSRNEAVVASVTELILTDESSFWSEVPSNIRVPQGSIVRQVCSCKFLSAFELCSHMQLQWTLNSVPILRDHNKYSMPNCGVLHINNVTAQDSGSYRCEAKVDETSESFVSPVGELNVVSLQESNNLTKDLEGWKYLPPSPPLLLFNFNSNVEGREGEKVALECIANDLDAVQPPVIWTKKDGSKFVPVRKKGITIDSDGTLIIQNATTEDRGSYRCELKSNSEKDLGYRLTQLKILQPPEFISPPTAMHFFNGLLGKFNCSARGVPRPNIELYKDGHPMDIGDQNVVISKSSDDSTFSTITISSASFLIIRKNYEGVYQCIAGNKVGIVTKASRMSVTIDENAPMLPSNIHIKESNGTSVLFAWEPSNSYETDIYTYNYHIFFGAAGKTHKDQVLGPNELQKWYTKLDPNTLYSFYMRTMALTSSSVLHASPLSEKIYHHSESPKLVSKKLKVDKSFNDDKTELTVQWKLKKNAIEHKIKWWIQGRENDFVEKVLGGDVNQYIITGIDPALAEVQVWVKKYANKDPSSDNTEDVEPSKDIEIKSKANDRLKLHLMSNDSDSVLIDWTLPDQLKDHEVNFNLTYVDAANPNNKDFVLIRSGSQSFLLKGIGFGCYRFLMFVQPSLLLEKIKDRSIASICIFKDVNKFTENLNNDAHHNSGQYKITNVTSTAVLFNWVPDEQLNPDFFSILCEEIQSGHLYDYDDIPNAGDSLSLTEHFVHFKRVSDYLKVVKSFLRTLTKTEVMFEYLKPSTTYRITIIPCTVENCGLLISSFLLTTLEGVPSSPMNFQWVALNTSSVKVSWTPPKYPNGKVLGYEVLYSHNNGANWVTKTSSSFNNNIILSQLVSNTKYLVSVTGRTATGKGTTLEGRLVIKAVLKRPSDDSNSVENIIVFVISTFVVVTCIILIYLLIRMCHLKRSVSLDRQSSPRHLPILTEEVKEPGALLHEMKTNHPIEVSTRHLDTKGRQNVEENVLLLQQLPSEEANLSRIEGSSSDERKGDCVVPTSMLTKLNNCKIETNKSNSLAVPNEAASS